MRATPRTLPGPDVLLPMALFLAGSLAFLGGGRLHPTVSPGALGGPFGSEQFYRGFAHEMLHTHGWQQMHMLILVGPILWALGAAGITRLLPARVGVLSEIGRAALLIAAGGWSLAFILDGFVAPGYARIIAATPPGSVTATMSAFGLSQLTMARLGTISIALVGAAIVAYAGALLWMGPLKSWRGVVGGLGLAVGIWPLVASLSGEFDPGPFTSSHWMNTALTIGFWMALLATALPSLGRATTAQTTAQ